MDKNVSFMEISIGKSNMVGVVDLQYLIDQLIQAGKIKSHPVPADDLPVGDTGYMDQVSQYIPGTWGHDKYGRLVLVAPLLTRSDWESWRGSGYIGTIFQRYEKEERPIVFGGPWPLHGAIDQKQYDDLFLLLMNDVPLNVPQCGILPNTYVQVAHNPSYDQLISARKNGR
jgi:hypothetical protein